MSNAKDDEGRRRGQATRLVRAGRAKHITGPFVNPPVVHASTVLFDSVEAMFANFERKPLYDTWRKDILHDYCLYGTRLNAEGKRELKCTPEIEAQLYASAHEFDGLGHLLRCKIPLLVMFGHRGQESPGASFAGRIAAELKNARVINFPDAGHFLAMEKPEEVTRLAVDFFTKG